MRHLGLKPQSVHRIGGHVVQGKDAEKAQQIVRDPRALEAAGCNATVLECIPVELARPITPELRIPTIGIAAGPHCDGEVLVLTDLLGMDDAFTPRFVKRSGEVGEGIRAAVRGYVDVVNSRVFPTAEHGFHSATVRLVAAEPEMAEHDEPLSGVFGAPV
jgi:3-methyl-2-oxobutanoate hydroxymethyltransferase